MTSVAAVACLVAGCGSSPTSSAPPAPSRAIGARLDGPVPARVLSMPLVDSTGRTRHLSDFAGKVLVISDSMTLCQEACPLDTASVVQAARGTERAGAGSDVEFLTVTVDPRRDTPHRLVRYRRLYRPTPANWVTLTGTPAHVRALWKAFGVYVKQVPDDTPAPRDWLTGKPLTYDVEHSDEVFFLDKHQHERFIFDGVPHVAGKSSIPRTLYQFMSSAGHRNITHPQGGSWTSQQALQVIGWLDKRQVERS